MAPPQEQVRGCHGVKPIGRSQQGCCSQVPCFSPDTHTWHIYMHTQIRIRVNVFILSLKKKEHVCLNCPSGLIYYFFILIVLQCTCICGCACVCVCVVRGLVHIRQVFHQCLSPVTQPPPPKAFKSGSCLKGSSLTLNLWTFCLNLLGSLNYRSVSTALVMICYNYCYKMYWYLWTVVTTILGWICHSSVDAQYQQPLNIYNLIFWMASYNTI